MLWISLLKIFSSATGTICLIRGIIGIPCPACGMIRAIKSLVQLKIKVAFYYNPLFFLPVILLMTAIFKRRYFKTVAIICAAALIVVYIIRMNLYFPNIEPMKINKDSIIMKIIN